MPCFRWNPQILKGYVLILSSNHFLISFMIFFGPCDFRSVMFIIQRVAVFSLYFCLLPFSGSQVICVLGCLMLSTVRSFMCSPFPSFLTNSYSKRRVEIPRYVHYGFVYFLFQVLLHVFGYIHV